MPGIIENHLGLGVVALVRFSPGRNKEGIILAPYREGRRQVLAEEFLELGIELDVGFVVTDEIELDLGALGPIQKGLVEENGLGRDALLGIGHAMVVLPPGSIQGLEFTEGIAILLGGLFPIGLDGSPVLAEAVDVGVTVLRNDRRYALGKAKRHAKAGGCAVIKDVNRELLQSELVDKIAHHFGHIREGILEDAMCGRVGKTKTGKVGGDDVKVLRQLRDQITEHVARGGKAVQKENGRLLWITDFPVENLESIHGHGFEGDVCCIHGAVGVLKE